VALEQASGADKKQQDLLRESGEIPRHIAIIMDGNGRWAKRRGLPRIAGHHEGVNSVRDIVEACGQLGVKYLTLYAFSTENWKRDKKEVDALMRLFEEYLRKEHGELLKNDTRFVHSGRKDRFPPTLAALIAKMEETTKDCKRYTLHVALDYGGRDEIVRAVKKMNSSDISEETLRAHLDHPELPDIDLVLRTGGEVRFSNFALWQAAYAEWIFIDKYFPDLTTDDLDACLATYRERRRRYGS